VFDVTVAFHQGVGIESHFFSEARKAVPLKRRDLAWPTARFSASCRDIFGRELLLTTKFNFLLEVATN
jgi:hypothetical protein